MTLIQFRVHFNSEFSVQFSAQCPEFSVQCSVFSVQCSVFSVQCSVFSVQCSVFSVQCSVFSVQCSVFSVQFNLEFSFQTPVFWNQVSDRSVLFHSSVQNSVQGRQFRVQVSSGRSSAQFGAKFGRTSLRVQFGAQLSSICNALYFRALLQYIRVHSSLEFS